jgi:SWI/SNF related-matrix-associated actin-dependent regulator of chromatin subfamily C
VFINFFTHKNSHDNSKIFNTLYVFKNAQEWRRFDLKNPLKKDKNLEMLSVVQTTLVEAGHLRWPEVYLSPGMSASTVNRLKEIVTSHQGKIVTSPQKATHIVIDKQDADPNEDPDKEYLRTIDHRDKSNLVHWWYYPDSYDTWLPATDVEGEQPDPDPPHHGVWKVSPRFLTDLEVFNEWMNELDYEIEEDENQEEEGRGGRGGRKGKKGSRKRNNEEEEDPTRRDAKKPKTKGKKRDDDEEDIDVDGEDHEGKGKKGSSSNPSTPTGTPKDKKSKKDDPNGSSADGFKIKISRDAVVCYISSPFSLLSYNIYI